MNMLSSLKALLFSTAAPGVAAVQPATPGETADFAALFNGTMAEETALLRPCRRSRDQLCRPLRPMPRPLNSRTPLPLPPAFR